MKLAVFIAALCAAGIQGAPAPQTIILPLPGVGTPLQQGTALGTAISSGIGSIFGTGTAGTGTASSIAALPNLVLGGGSNMLSGGSSLLGAGNSALGSVAGLILSPFKPFLPTVASTAAPTAAPITVNPAANLPINPRTNVPWDPTTGINYNPNGTALTTMPRLQAVFPQITEAQAREFFPYLFTAVDTSTLPKNPRTGLPWNPTTGMQYDPVSGLPFVTTDQVAARYGNLTQTEMDYYFPEFSTTPTTSAPGTATTVAPISLFPIRPFSLIAQAGTNLLGGAVNLGNGFASAIANAANTGASILDNGLGLVKNIFTG